MIYAYLIFKLCTASQLNPFMSCPAIITANHVVNCEEVVPTCKEEALSFPDAEDAWKAFEGIDRGTLYRLECHRGIGSSCHLAKIGEHR